MVTGHGRGHTRSLSKVLAVETSVISMYYASRQSSEQNASVLSRSDVLVALLVQYLGQYHCNRIVSGSQAREMPTSQGIAGQLPDSSLHFHFHFSYSPRPCT